MKAHWLVAKYMEDLQRREPVNVGLVALVDGQIHRRFVGQKSPESALIDGRQAQVAGDHKMYKAWVEHWFDASETVVTADDLRSLCGGSPSQYVLEPSGRAVVPAGDAVSFVEQLFERLVARKRPAQAPSLRQSAEALVGRAKHRGMSVVEDVRFQIGGGQKMRFDYRVGGDGTRLIKVLEVGEAEWDRVNGTSHGYDVLSAEKPEGATPVLVTLTRAANDDSDAREQVALLRKHSSVFDVNGADEEDLLRVLMPAAE